MSTRANIIVVDDHTKIWLYQHGDGYPDGVLPKLEIFLTWIKEGRVRNNAVQSAVWLILLGVKDLYEMYKESSTATNSFRRSCIFEPGPKDASMGWQAGFIETTEGEHGDIAYLYMVNVKYLFVDCRDVYGGTETRYSLTGNKLLAVETKKVSAKLEEGRPSRKLNIQKEV